MQADLCQVVLIHADLAWDRFDSGLHPPPRADLGTPDDADLWPQWLRVSPVDLDQGVPLVHLFLDGLSCAVVALSSCDDLTLL